MESLKEIYNSNKYKEELKIKYTKEQEEKIFKAKEDVYKVINLCVAAAKEGIGYVFLSNKLYIVDSYLKAELKKRGFDVSGSSTGGPSGSFLGWNVSGWTYKEIDIE